nr:cell division protein [Chloroidium sp. KL-2023a]
MRRLLLKCSRPVGSTELRALWRSESEAIRPNANVAHSAGVGQKALNHRWLLHNPRYISIQWFEKVGFTFSPFAFIFGTTFLFAALANTLHKQAGKQWLKTLSHTKLPGFYENKVSQKSSWVFLESVLSQYINKDNSFLASTTYLSKDAPYSTKLEKAMPRTGYFRDQTRGTQTFAKQRLELAKTKHGQPEFYFGAFDRSKSATRAIAGTERRQRPGCLPQAGVQIQLSPLWGHHLKKDFLGVFLGASRQTFENRKPLHRTNIVCDHSDKGFANQAFSSFQGRTRATLELPTDLRKLPIRTSVYFACRAKLCLLHRTKSEQSGPLRGFRATFELPEHTSGYSQKLGLSRSSEQNVNISKIGGLTPRTLGYPKRGLRKGESYLTNYKPGFVNPAKLVPDQSSVLPPELKTTLTCPWYKITAYYPTNCFIVPTWNESTTTQIDRRLNRIKAKPAKTNLALEPPSGVYGNTDKPTGTKDVACSAKLSTQRVEFANGAIEQAPKKRIQTDSGTCPESKLFSVSRSSEAPDLAFTKSVEVAFGSRKFGPECLDFYNKHNTMLYQAKSGPEPTKGLITAAIDQLFQKSDNTSSDTLRKMVRELELLALCSRAPSWFFGELSLAFPAGTKVESSPSTKSIPFFGHTDVERFRLEDDSIPSKKYSIYSKNKRHQETLSDRVLHAVKKSFYEYGLSIPNFRLPFAEQTQAKVFAAEPPNWVAAQLPSRPEVFDNFRSAHGLAFIPLCLPQAYFMDRQLELRSSSPPKGARTLECKPTQSLTPLQGESAPAGPKDLDKLVNSQTDGAKFRSANSGFRLLSEAEHAQGWPQHGSESANFSQGGYECGRVTIDRENSAKSFCASEGINQDSGRPSSEAAEHSSKPVAFGFGFAWLPPVTERNQSRKLGPKRLELGYIFKNIAIPQKSFWKSVHSLSGYNFPELQDYEVADLFRSKLRFGRTRKAQQMAASLESKEGHLLAKLKLVKLKLAKLFCSFRLWLLADDQRLLWPRRGPATQAHDILSPMGSPTEGLGFRLPFAEQTQVKPTPTEYLYFPQAYPTDRQLERSSSSPLKGARTPGCSTQGRVAPRVTLLPRETGRRYSKLDKYEKLGVIPPINSGFCRAINSKPQGNCLVNNNQRLLLNSVFLTPYLVKIPPKVLVYLTEKTESLSPQESVLFTTSLSYVPETSGFGFARLPEVTKRNQNQKPLDSYRYPKVWHILSEAEHAPRVSGTLVRLPLKGVQNGDHKADSDFSIECTSGQSQSKPLLGNFHVLSEALQPKVWEKKVSTPTGQSIHTVSRESKAQVNNVEYQRAEPLVEDSTIRYTPLDLKQENRVKKVFKELGRDYSGYLKQPKDSLPALLLSPSLEEDKQIEEEEFKRLAQEKAAAKAAAKQTQNEKDYNTSDSATIEEESNLLNPLEGALTEKKNNVNNLEEEPLNDEEIEDSRFERLRFTRELETKKDEEDCRGLALALTRRGSHLTKQKGGCVDPLVQHGQPELRSANFIRARKNISGSTLFRSVPPLFLGAERQTFGCSDKLSNRKPNKDEHKQEVCFYINPSVNQFAPKKLEVKVSERKHSFFGQRSFWPTRLFSQEERLVSAHVVNPYIRYDQRNPWLILEQGSGLRFTTLHTKTSTSDDLQNLKNLQTQARLGLIRFVHFPLVSSQRAKRQLLAEGQHLISHTTKRRSKVTPLVVERPIRDELAIKRRPEVAVESSLYTYKTGNQQNRIYKSDPRLRLTPRESSLSADWRNERKVEASPFRITSKERVVNVLPKLSDNQWQKNIEWQLKRHFFDEDTRLESLVATEPFKTFKYKKIERSLPWLTMAGTGKLSQSESVRLANSNFHLNFALAKRKLGPSGLEPEWVYATSEGQESKVDDRSTERYKKPFFNLFQWPYKTVGVVSPLSLSGRGYTFSIAGCATNTRSTANYAPRVTRDKGLSIIFFEEGFWIPWLNPVLPPFRLGHYSRIPLASSFTTYSKDSSALLKSSNSLFDVTKKLFSNQGDLNTELLFEGVSSCSWFCLYRLLLALILKEVFKYIYRISLKDFFIRIINSDFGQTVTSPEFRHKVQFSPFPEFYKPKNRLKDLIGIKNALLPLSEIIWFLRNNCRSRNGPHGVILFGPEGVDTTAIAQAVAGEAKVPIIVQSLRALTLTHSHPQKRLEKVLLLARAKSPCVLFLDELDVIGQSREGVIRKTSGNENPLISLDSNQFPRLSLACSASPSTRSFAHPIEAKVSESTEPTLHPSGVTGTPLWQSQSPHEQSTSQGRRVDLMLRLLTVMDGLHHLNGVVIITTSKNTATLDPALLRPGRFDRVIHLTLPNHEQRVELFKAKTGPIFDRRFSNLPTGGSPSAERSSGCSQRGLGLRHTNNRSLDERSSFLSVDELEYLSLRTKNMSGADIVSAINYSTLRAIVNETVHTVETLEYGLNCVKALKASA